MLRTLTRRYDLAVRAPSANVWISTLDTDGETWLFDLSFLASSWTCIFGNGCKGVLEEDATDLQHGCCTHGAHFADEDDRARVEVAINRLRPDQWHNSQLARSLGGPLATNDDGAWTTRTHDGVCIFHNPPDSPAGLGCALHGAALEAGERPLDWKPNVCWQLPLRLEAHTDENGRITNVLRAWDRADWGEGGAHFHWWCTEDPEAFVGHRPVVDELADEITELIGPALYNWLRKEISHGAGYREPKPDPKILAGTQSIGQHATVETWLGLPTRR